MRLRSGIFMASIRRTGKQPARGRPAEDAS